MPGNESDHIVLDQFILPRLSQLQQARLEESDLLG